jgi:hypothetical protein
MTRSVALLATTAFGLLAPSFAFAASPYDAMIAQHAAANGVPVELVHRVIVRESRYNPRAVNSGNYGMMQIRLGTARGLGYTGSAQGLLDPNTNLTYAVKYLAGAYKVAGGNHHRAVSLYAGGYYYAAKRQGMAIANPRGLTSDAPVFASFTPGATVAPAIAAPVAAPATSGIAPVMSEAGAARAVVAVAPLPGSSEANRAFRAAKAHDAQAAQTSGIAMLPKDASRPRSARNAQQQNPLAGLFGTEKPQPRRATRHRQG